VFYYQTITTAEKNMVVLLAYSKFKPEQWFPPFSYLRLLAVACNET